jgi:hypothetical protein
LEAIYLEEKVELMSVVLKNLPIAAYSSTEKNIIRLRYDSEKGLIFLEYGDSGEKLLSLLSLNDAGLPIVESFNAVKFMLPGRFRYPGFTTSLLKLQLTVQSLNKTTDAVGDAFFTDINDNSEACAGAIVRCYPRTNVI